jgi:murein DD-endopeptidase MepM/ murein hydrolase activator NlpD
MFQPGGVPKISPEFINANKSLTGPKIHASFLWWRYGEETVTVWHKSLFDSVAAALGSRKIVGIALVVLGSLTGACYLWLLPRVAANVPLTCSVQELSSAGVESKSADVMADQSDASPGCEGSVETAGVTAEGDTLHSLLASNLSEDPLGERVAAKLAAKISQITGKTFYAFTPLKSDRSYNIITDLKGRFLKATMVLDPASVFHAVREDQDIRCWKEVVVLDFKPETIRFEIRGNGTLSEAVLAAGEGQDLEAKLRHVFRWDIDFQSESRKGDVCKVLFERRYADDRPSGYGRILCAVYDGEKTGKKTAILFNGKYYNEKGLELKRNFLRSPLNVLRVTSRYGRRFHPILKRWRKHNGVDYGAPMRTPVWSVARGRVTFAGWKRGYGKYVCIKHDNGIESRYGHLSRIYVRKGQRVKQRYTIGRVGMTGLATGPHLDFQLLVNGRHVDPLKMRMVRSLRRVARPLKPRFDRVVQQRLLSLTNLLLSQRTAPTTLANLR